ncbi:hypothetical protein B0H17DRAFT_1330769 [Mycena rosella]|uniref:Uncharacterized protein n=1 Tax=Mycena rosella TaxID=1033263 RepID=A0AAD7DIX2_MYCRO|nr:hypothetical protein B0H17DRAFT_1330769 [Mycena rosella]
MIGTANIAELSTTSGHAAQDVLTIENAYDDTLLHEPRERTRTSASPLLTPLPASPPARTSNETGSSAVPALEKHQNAPAPRSAGNEPSRRTQHPRPRTAGYSSSRTANTCRPHPKSTNTRLLVLVPAPTRLTKTKLLAHTTAIARVRFAEHHPARAHHSTLAPAAATNEVTSRTHAHVLVRKAPPNPPQSALVSGGGAGSSTARVLVLVRVPAPPPTSREDRTNVPPLVCELLEKPAFVGGTGGSTDARIRVPRLETNALLVAPASVCIPPSPPTSREDDCACRPPRRNTLPARIPTPASGASERMQGAPSSPPPKANALGGRCSGRVL